MTGRIVHEPWPHECAPGWTRYTITGSPSGIPGGSIGMSPPDTGIPDGAIWECDCGRTWVAHRDRRHGHPAGLLAPSFRPETRFQRWRRQRRAPDPEETP